MTTAPALLPCPFCGEQPLTHNGYTRLYTIACQSPKCAVQVSCSVVGEPEAIAAWNARPGGGEAVREALVELVAAADYKAVLVVVGADMHDRHEAVDDFWRAIDKAKAALRTQGASHD